MFTIRGTRAEEARALVMRYSHRAGDAQGSSLGHNGRVYSTEYAALQTATSKHRDLSKSTGSSSMDKEGRLSQAMTKAMTIFFVSLAVLGVLANFFRFMSATVHFH